jgi:pilus assembly protein Flp/PilA
MDIQQTTARERENGASMVEYALLIVLIAIIAFVAVTLAGEELSATFSDIASSVDAAN